ncbi:hypothetical protein [Paenibacillus pini]|nr:hypothetical protein [Paenibacillus pini]
MKISFQHPIYLVPCVVLWEERVETLMFDFEDYIEAEKEYSSKIIDSVRE